jgi:hypothetical protein
MPSSSSSLRRCSAGIGAAFERIIQAAIGGGAGDAGKPYSVSGYYLDKLVKEGGRWFFKERQIYVNYLGESSPLEKLPGT